MAFYLMAEIKNKKDDPNYKGKFDQYISALPADVKDFPACFSDEELNLLKGSVIYDKAIERRKGYENDYQLLCQIIPEFKEFTLEDYMYATIMCQSRSFEFTVEGQSQRFLCPIADMLDHKHPPENKWFFDEKTNCYLIQA